MDTSEILEIIQNMYARHIPFHQFLGMEISGLSDEGVQLKVKMRPELVGNPFYQILHGGVTSAMLDAAGGMVAMASVVAASEGLSPEQLQKKLQRLGTIDIRIDYLRPGKGEEFTATARVIRRGNKVAVTRMELHNENKIVVALGTATYKVG